MNKDRTMKFMKIELKSIEWNKGASEETLCFSGKVWVDGVAAFWAVNHGHGGSTMFRPVAGYTGPDLGQVDGWLAKDRAPVVFEGGSCPYDLEQFCFDEILVREQYQTMKRKMRAAVLFCEDGQLFSYKYKPVPAAIDAVKQKHPKGVVLNPLPDEFIWQAARQLFAKAA